MPNNRNYTAVRKPIDTGVYSWEPIFLLGSGGKVKRFSKAGAQRYADKQAQESGLRHAVGRVTDCGGNYRITVMAQEERLI
jgi:hypothetical protein